MKSRLETEAEVALSMAHGLIEDFVVLDRYLPASKRGSNAQRVLDRMKSRSETIVLCLNDGLHQHGKTV